MAVLILLANSASPITVTCRKAGKSAPRKVGGVFPSFAGALRTSVRGEAKVIPIATSLLTAAEESAIQVAVSSGVQIACSGDILGNIQTLCSFDAVTSDIVPGTSPELWTMSFTINEVNASTILLKYAAGDTITGESFTRSTTGLQIDGNGVVLSAAINAKRDSHYGGGATRSLLLEDSRINALSKSQQFDDAAWTKGGSTITADAIAAPDGTTTADKLAEDASVGAHYVTRTLTTTASTNQPTLVFAKAAERTWCRVTSQDRAGVSRSTWINLSTGTVGTKDASHTIRVTSLAASWFQIEMDFNSGAGAGAVSWFICVATADAVSSYAGSAGSGVYIWGG